MRIPTIERAGEKPVLPAYSQAPQPLPGGPGYGDSGAARARHDPLPAGEVRLEAVKAPLAWHVVRGIALSIVTLGIHRFWYRTALRRYYWSNTRLGGDAFEYTGTGKELFVGFLIAIAIVVPIYVLVMIIGIVGGQLLGPIVASVLGAVIMPAVVQILVYRARRYRLQRTRYRGVRFHQTGTGTGYLLRSVKWILLTALTLGILYPYLRRALERYKIEHTWYGSARGSFSAAVGPMMKFWLLMWLVLALAVGCAVAVPLHFTTGRVPGALMYGLASLGLVLLLPILWQGFRVREFRAFVAGTRIGELGMRSDLSTRSVVWVWISYYLVLLALGAGLATLGWLIAQQRMEGLDGGGMRDFMENPSGFLTSIASVFGFIVVMSVVTELVLRRRLWALRARSITVTNLASLDSVVQTTSREATGIGEAFDTGFDIAG